MPSEDLDVWECTLCQYNKRQGAAYVLLLCQIKFQQKIKSFSAGRDHLKYSLETEKFLLIHWETLSPVSTACLAQFLPE